jgi:hypothetical protein
MLRSVSQKHPSKVRRNKKGSRACYYKHLYRGQDSMVAIIEGCWDSLLYSEGCQKSLF